MLSKSYYANHLASVVTIYKFMQKPSMRKVKLLQLEQSNNNEQVFTSEKCISKYS